MGRDAIDGLINLNKPKGKTSFQMVSLVRRLSGVRKVGHSGTLDPDATGVLPILIGRPTRLATFLTESTKVYRAEVEFGISTDTYDASGNVVQRGDTSALATERIEAALDSFRGVIEQTPPMYSAIKYQGKPLYHLARAGVEVPRQSRKVTISRLEITDWQSPVLCIEVECSKGTYIRSLAHDLGQVLACGAHLKSLVRTRTGPFHIDESISVEQLENGFQSGTWDEFLYPPDFAIAHLDAVVVDSEGEEALVHGRAFSSSDDQTALEGEQRRAYSSDGRFLALVCFNQEDNLWQPKRVFV